MSEPRRVFVTGASGLLGRALVKALVERGDHVLAVSRKSRPDRQGVTWLAGDLGDDADPIFDRVGECDAVVHLAGESIAAGRWTEARKRRLVSSRVDTAKRIVGAMRDAASPPSVFVCASAVGYYGQRGDEVLSEDAAPGDDFLARLCVDWEAAAQQAASLGVRVVSLRFGVVLSRSGGALTPLALPFRFGFGGPIGPKGDYFPWIHERDARDALLFALDSALSGPVNATAPEPCTMEEFASAIGAALGRPSWLPLPVVVLRIAAGELADALVPSQRVVPGVLQAAGFRFHHPEVRGAMRDCLG